MAFASSGKITSQIHSTSSSTWTPYNLTAAAGEMVLLMIAADNSRGTTDDSTEIKNVTGGATWKKAYEYRYSAGSAGDGCIIGVWYCYVTTAFSSQAIEITFANAIVKKVATFWRFTCAAEPQVAAKTGYGAKAEDLNSLSVSGLGNAQYLFWRAHAGERGTFSFQATSGWTDVTTNTTNNNDADTEIAIAGEFLLATATNATSSPKTFNYADHTDILIAFSEGAPPAAGAAPSYIGASSLSSTPSLSSSNKREFCGYYPSWLGQLTDIDSNYTCIKLSFAKPDFTWGGTGNGTPAADWTGTGIQFTDSPSTIKSRITALKNAGVKVLVSVGGATYTAWATLIGEAGLDNQATKNHLKNFILDMGLDGIDVDYETQSSGPGDTANEEKYAKAIQACREACDAAGGTRIIAVAGWSTGADATDSSDTAGWLGTSYATFGSAGRERATFKRTISGGAHNGKLVRDIIDRVFVMAYDASSADTTSADYDPVIAYILYRNICPSRILVTLGMQTYQQAWGETMLMDLDSQCTCLTTYNSGNYAGRALGTDYKNSVERFIREVRANTTNTNNLDGVGLWHMLKTNTTSCGSNLSAQPVTIQNAAQSALHVTTPTAVVSFSQHLPGSYAENDMVVWGINSDGAADVSLPAGWIKVVNQVTGPQGGRFTVAVKVLGASEPSSATCNQGTARMYTSVMTLYRGTGMAVDAAQVIANQNAQVSPYTMPVVAVTTNVENARLVWIGGLDANESSSGFSISLSDQHGFTLRRLRDNSDSPVMIADKVQTAAGASGNLSGTGVGTVSCGTVAALLALKTTTSSSPRYVQSNITLGSLTTSSGLQPKAGARTNAVLGSLTSSSAGESQLSAEEVAWRKWLASAGTKRTILVEANVSVNDAEVVRYMSNSGYVSETGVFYEPVIVGGITITETLATDGSGGLQYGDFELDNHDGSKDGWLGDVWMNRPIRVYIGDANWNRSDFRLVMAGIIYNVDSRSSNRLNIVIRDKLQRLNAPITEEVLGGITLNSERLLPLTFGECHNIEPLLTNPATLEYKFHQGSVQRIIEVRDNGVPVAIDAYPASGLFRLMSQPAGTITASIQGENTPAYANTIAKLIARIATGFGKAQDRFTKDDIDDTFFANFERAHPQPVGIYLDDRTNVLEIIEQLAKSVGAQVCMTRTGKLQLLKLELPPPPSAYPLTTITDEDMVHDSMQIVSRSEVRAAVKLGYCRNWHVQDNLLTKLPADHKQMMKREWLTVSSRDDNVALKHRLHKEPEQENTLLLVKANAQAEANRRLAFRKQQRTIYRYTGFESALNLRLGQAVELKVTPFSIPQGAIGLVVGLAPDWLEGRCEVEVIL